MLKFHLDKRVLAGFFLALAIVAGLAVYSYVSTRKLIATSKAIADAHSVLFHAERLMSLAANIELGQRGFALTGNERFLEPYRAGLTQIKPHVRELDDLLSRREGAYRSFAPMSGKVDTLVVFSTAAVAARQKDFETAQKMNSTLQGKLILDRFRRSVIDLESREKQLLDGLVSDHQDQIRNFNVSFIGLLLVAGLILVLLLITLNVNMKARSETEKQLVRASEEIQDLYDNAPCGYHSLNASGVFIEINKTLTKWLGFDDKHQVIGKMRFEDVISENDLKNFREAFPRFIKTGFVKNIEFNFKRRDGSEFPVLLSSVALYDEQGHFVKSRSNTFDNTDRKQAEQQVIDINKELEAFTYSVSHDLRAPLRSIDGYTRILFEDYQDKLDQEGRRLMTVIINNARRMGKLIDDLLDFSRLGRKEIQMATIEMTPLVKTIVNDQLEQEKERKIDVVIHPLNSGYGDIDMIRQVWVNL
ncbi:MAG TPA: CHASE3 domain-containing protein, partial [Chryseosolibacter sp.]|nr:CHASE3 domain-containing protein [Chryseosolibacter sp.]